MESALLLLIRSAACYGPAPGRFWRSWSPPVAPSSAAQASPRNLFLSTGAFCFYAARRYDSPRAISDHTMRAFLFANATQAFDVPSLRCLSAIQRLRGSVLWLARYTTERAPWIKRVRR